MRIGYYITERLYCVSVRPTDVLRVSKGHVKDSSQTTKSIFIQVLYVTVLILTHCLKFLHKAQYQGQGIEVYVIDSCVISLVAVRESNYYVTSGVYPSNSDFEGRARIVWRETVI